MPLSVENLEGTAGNSQCQEGSDKGERVATQLSGALLVSVLAQ